MATVSRLLLVQELTARIKSPRESFCRGRKMREFLFMTPVETANPVPTFIEHTLRCVLRPLAAQHKLLSRRGTDTCVLFFYTLILQTRQSPAFPDEDTFPEYPKNVAAPSRQWDISLEADGPACLLSGSLRDVSRFEEPSAAAPENKGDIGRGPQRLLNAILP